MHNGMVKIAGEKMDEAWKLKKRLSQQKTDLRYSPKDCLGMK